MLDTAGEHRDQLNRDGIPCPRCGRPPIRLTGERWPLMLFCEHCDFHGLVYHEGTERIGVDNPRPVNFDVARKGA
jgi:hypothetical protein